MSKKPDPAAIIGAKTASVTIPSGLEIEFRAPRLKELIEIEKKIGRPVLQSMDRMETAVILISRLGTSGGVPLNQTAIEETWTVDDLTACLEVIGPLFQRSTPAAAPSSPDGSFAAVFDRES